MSGFEVVGVVLSAIPILVEGLSVYKKSSRTITKGFRKKRTVDHLLRALTTQGEILQLLVAQILRQSGCDEPVDCPDEIQEVLRGPGTKDAIGEYLGKNRDAVMGAVNECEESFHRLATKVARFVPAIKTSTNLAHIMKANRFDQGGMNEMFAKMSLTLRIEEIEQDLKKLDASVDTLDRLIRLISSSRETTDNAPSRQSKKLAKMFLKTRKNADDLYYGVAAGWANGCHQKHEVRLLLEDRMTESDSCGAGQHQRSENTDIFNLIFSTEVAGPNGLWHQSIVQVQPSETEGSTTVDALAANVVAKPRVRVTDPERRVQRLATIEVNDICSAIKAGYNRREHVAFALTPERKIATDPNHHLQLSRPDAKEAIPLKELFQEAVQHSSRRSLLSWRTKSVLALKMASSFLQLLHTPWTSQRFSTDSLTFLQHTMQEVDIQKPFLVRSFEALPAPSGAPATHQQIKEPLIELGISLLEIWHARLLQDSRSEDPRPESSTTVSLSFRRMQAMDWLEECKDDIPPQYYQAVFNCLVGTMNSFPSQAEWNDMTLWEIMCESVVHPLFKFSKTWKT